LYFGESDPYFSVYTDHLPMVLGGATREEIADLSPDMQQVYKTWENPPEYELYDLDNDPWEFNNLAESSDHQIKLTEMKEILYDWQMDTRDPFANPEMFARIREEV